MSRGDGPRGGLEAVRFSWLVAPIQGAGAHRRRNPGLRPGLANVVLSGPESAAQKAPMRAPPPNRPLSS